MRGVAGLTNGLAGLGGSPLRSTAGLAGLNDGLGGLTMVSCVCLVWLQYVHIRGGGGGTAPKKKDTSNRFLFFS